VYGWTQPHSLYYAFVPPHPLPAPLPITYIYTYLLLVPVLLCHIPLVPLHCTTHLFCGLLVYLLPCYLCLLFATTLPHLYSYSLYLFYLVTWFLFCAHYLVILYCCIWFVTLDAPCYPLFVHSQIYYHIITAHYDPTLTYFTTYVLPLPPLHAFTHHPYTHYLHCYLRIVPFGSRNGLRQPRGCRLPALYITRSRTPSTVALYLCHPHLPWLFYTGSLCSTHCVYIVVYISLLQAILQLPHCYIAIPLPHFPTLRHCTFPHCRPVVRGTTPLKHVWLPADAVPIYIAFLYLRCIRVELPMPACLLPTHFTLFPYLTFALLHYLPAFGSCVLPWFCVDISLHITGSCPTCTLLPGLCSSLTLHLVLVHTYPTLAQPPHALYCSSSHSLCNMLHIPFSPWTLVLVTLNPHCALLRAMIVRLDHHRCYLLTYCLYSGLVTCDVLPHRCHSPCPTRDTAFPATFFTAPAPQHLTRTAVALRVALPYHRVVHAHCLHHLLLLLYRTLPLCV